MRAQFLVDPPTVQTKRPAIGRVPRLWHFATEYLLALPLGVLVALVWANADAGSYYRAAQRMAFLVNDVAMAAFFALITKEIIEATVPGGVLHPWRRAASAVVASSGIAIVPVVLFAVLVRVFGEPALVRGWPTVLAVDVAAGYFVARVIFGKHPAIAFFLLLAISANAFGFIALTIVEPTRELRFGTAALLMSAAIGVAVAFRNAKVRSPWPYVTVAGALSWSAFYFGGFHPALALVPIVPFLPHATRDPGFFVDAPPRAKDALNRLERLFRHPAQVALFGFGLVNGGVSFSAVESGVWCLPLAALVGKPIGLLAGVAVGHALGFHLPPGVQRRDLLPLGFISAIGLTMALFFATATVGTGQLLSELKVGTLIGLISGVAAIASAKLVGAGRFHGAAGLSPRRGGI